MSVHVGGRGPGHSSRKFRSGGSGGPDATQRVTIPYQLVKLDDLNPIIRNDNNTAHAQEIKIGPSAVMNISGTWHIWIEGIQNTGFPVNDGMTAFMKATATSLQGPYTLSPATSRILDAGDESTWEHYELSPADVVLSGGNLVFMCHGGNNSGPQHMGVVRSSNTTDGTTNFTKDPGNPLLVCGATGAWDDRQSGNDFKLVRYHNVPGNPFTGALWAAFRGRKTGSLTDGLVGRAVVSADYTTFTKDATAGGQVIFSAPSWNSAGGVTSGTPVLDEGGRAHMWAPGGANGIGKYYSDDDGRTWTVENSGNRVAAPTGTAGAYDKTSTGDVVQAIWDGDVIFLLYGTENIGDYPTNNPMRGQSGAIVPFPKVTPTRLGKFFLASARTDVTSTTLLTQTSFTIMGRFRAYRVKRTKGRMIYCEEASGGSFNKQCSVYVTGGTGGANDGKLQFFYRTPTALVQIFSTAVVDDATWHTFVARRVSTNSFELILDGVSQGTSANNPTTDATAMLKAVGNFNPSTSEPDSCFNGTLSDVGIVTGAAWTGAEGAAWISGRTLGTGGTVVFDLATNGTTGESGNVVKVEAA